MSATTTTEANHRMSSRAAAKATGFSVHTLLKLAAAGKVRTYADPGVSMKFDRRDIDRVAAEKRTREEGRAEIGA